MIHGSTRLKSTGSARSLHTQRYTRAINQTRKVRELLLFKSAFTLPTSDGTHTHIYVVIIIVIMFYRTSVQLPAGAR